MDADTPVSVLVVVRLEGKASEVTLAIQLVESILVLSQCKSLVLMESVTAKRN